MTSGIPDTDSEQEFGYGQLLAVLLRRRFWLLGMLMATLCSSVAMTATTEPTFQSKMQLLVEPNYPERETIGEQNGNSFFSKDEVEIDYATQLTLMRSTQFIEKVAGLLSSQYPELDIEEMEKNLSLKRVEEDKVGTRIFEAVYIDNDAAKTQEVLRVLQQVYQDYNAEQEKERLNRGLAFINQGLPETQQSFVDAEEALRKFREGENLVNPEQQAENLATTLNLVEQERQQIRAQYKDTQARYQALQKQLSLNTESALVSSRLSQSSRYQALLDELQKTELALAQQRVRFTDNAPTVQGLLEEKRNQKALLQQEVSRVLGENAKLPNQRGNLLQEGQLGAHDLDMASKLAEIETELSGLRGRDQALVQTESELRSQMARFPKIIAEYNRLQPEVDIQRQNIEQLLATRQELSLEIARGGFNWQIVEAQQLGEQTGPSLPKNLLLGGVAGLFLGGIAAFVRESLDDAVRSSQDLQQRVRLPLLGVVPQLNFNRASSSIMSIPFNKPQKLEPTITQVIHHPLFRESIDLVYKNIQLFHSNSVLKSLSVTSALMGEGKSTLVLGLALSAARANQKVLLIDANLRYPTLHHYLNLPNEQGLSTLLSHDTNLPSASQPCPMPHVWLSTLMGGKGNLPLGSNVDILTAGPIPEDPVQLLSSPRMRELMAVFEQNYDLVILDTCPVLGTVDAIQAASFCSGTLIVGRIGQVTQSDFAQAVGMLRKLNVIGLVANGVEKVKRSALPF